MLTGNLASLEVKFNSLTSDSVLILNRASMGMSNDEISAWGKSWGYTHEKIHESFLEIFRVLEFENDVTAEHARAEAVAFFLKCKKAGFPHIPERSSTHELRVRIKTEPIAKREEVAMTVESKHFEALSRQEKSFLAALATYQNDMDVMRTQKLTSTELEVLQKDIASFFKLDVKLTPPQRRGLLVSIHQRHHVKMVGNEHAPPAVPEGVKTSLPQTVVVRPPRVSEPEEKKTMAKKADGNSNDALFTNIRAAAQKKGMTIAAMCAKARVSQSLINNLRIRKAPPEKGFVSSIAEALGVSSETLLHGVAFTPEELQTLTSTNAPAAKLEVDAKVHTNGAKNGAAPFEQQYTVTEAEPSPASRALTVVNQQSKLLENPERAANIARLSKLLSQVQEPLRTELAKEIAPLMD